MSDRDMLMDIRERLVAIETHLRDMNGKLIRHDKVLVEDCPGKHVKITEELQCIRADLLQERTKTSIFIGIASGFVGSVVTVVVGVVITKFFGGW